MNTNDLIAAVSQWAEGEERVLAAALVGSHARGVARPDSDIDLVLICSNPLDFLDDLDWVHRFGEAKFAGVEDYGLVQSVRVFYADGLEVEFGITSTAWITPPIDEGTAEVMRAGMLALYDPDEQLSLALNRVGP